MESLDQIACRLGTDKSTLRELPPGPDGFAARSGRGTGYTLIYDDWFRPLRDQPVTLLEIGVLDGRSLQMWSEYFAGGRIYGLDIDPACERFSDGRKKVFIGSQADEAVLTAVGAAVPGGFDIVIDDGSHYVKHMIASFGGLWEHVKPGGTYVIEDVHLGAYEGWGQVAFNKGMALQPQAGNNARELVDFLEGVRGRADVFALSLFYGQICFIRKRAAGDPADAPYQRGGDLDELLPKYRPLWRRIAGRIL